MRRIIVVCSIAAVLAAPACSRQESGWQRASREDTIAAYQAYLAKFPAGAHAADARARVNELFDEQAWTRAMRLGTPEAWQHYLGDWPQGRHAEIARRKLVEFIPSSSPPDTARPAAAGFSIQLGAFSSEAAAREGLDRLTRESSSALAGLSVEVHAPPEGTAPFWRLRAGPFDEAAARAHCARLAAAGISCMPVADASRDRTPV
jgi:hypothetical protein